MFGITRRALMGAFVLGAMGLAQPVLADDGHPYFGPEAVDLTVLLVPLVSARPAAVPALLTANVA